MDKMGIAMGHKLKIAKKIRELRPPPPPVQPRGGPGRRVQLAAEAETVQEPAPAPPGGSLLDGEYDEAEQAASFAAAVAAWRTGGEEPRAQPPEQTSPPKASNPSSFWASMGGSQYGAADAPAAVRPGTAESGVAASVGSPDKPRGVCYRCFRHSTKMGTRSSAPKSAATRTSRSRRRRHRAGPTSSPRSSGSRRRSSSSTGRRRRPPPRGLRRPRTRRRRTWRRSLSRPSPSIGSCCRRRRACRGKTCAPPLAVQGRPGKLATCGPSAFFLVCHLYPALLRVACLSLCFFTHVDGANSLCIRRVFCGCECMCMGVGVFVCERGSAREFFAAGWMESLLRSVQGSRWW